MGKIEELEAQVVEYEKIIENKEELIGRLYEEIDDFNQKIEETTIQINNIKYGDIELEEGQCFHYINEKWFYHDVKEVIRVIEKVLGINPLKPQLILFREYVIKDDDGDTFFYIKKKLNKSKGDFIDDLKENFKEISKEEAQRKVDEWIKISN